MDSDSLFGNFLRRSVFRSTDKAIQPGAFGPDREKVSYTSRFGDTLPRVGKLWLLAPKARGEGWNDDKAKTIRPSFARKPFSGFLPQERFLAGKDCQNRTAKRIENQKQSSVGLAGRNFRVSLTEQSCKVVA